MKLVKPQVKIPIIPVTSATTARVLPLLGNGSFINSSHIHKKNSKAQFFESQDVHKS